MVKTTKKTTKIPKTTVAKVLKPKIDQVAIRQRVTDAMVQALIESMQSFRYFLSLYDGIIIETFAGINSFSHCWPIESGW